MKKNGFTLIELLVVIVLMSMLLVLVVPNIIDSLKEGKDKLNSSQISQIKEATALYLNDYCLNPINEEKDSQCGCYNESCTLNRTYEKNVNGVTEHKVYVSGNLSFETLKESGYLKGISEKCEVFNGKTTINKNELSCNSNLFENIEDPVISLENNIEIYIKENEICYINISCSY